MKKASLLQGKTVFDHEAIFAHLLLVGQQRNIDLQEVLAYELSAVPPSLMNLVVSGKVTSQY